MNKLSKAEEDLCTMCRYLSKVAAPEREYVGGANPRTGVTVPTRGDL